MQYFQSATATFARLIRRAVLYNPLIFFRAGPRKRPGLLFPNDKKWLRNLYQRLWTRRIAL